jgi:hypothetical protein
MEKIKYHTFGTFLNFNRQIIERQFSVCPNPRPGFPRPFVEVFSVFSSLWWYQVVLSVDVGGIVDNLFKPSFYVSSKGQINASFII